MATTQKVVLLACGSYNPPTNMHLRMFELARDYLQRNGKYNVIAGIMSPVSDGYNKKDLAPAKHRCEMVKLALKSSKWIRLDKWESDQPQWLETAVVLAHHRTRLTNQANTVSRPAPTKKRKKDKNNEDVIERNAENSSPRHCARDEGEGVQLKLLCGGDLLESFAVPGLWKDEDIEEIVGKYGLVCITRNGSDPRKFIYESDVLTRHQENIHIVTEWIQNEVSSTKIRRALRRCESVKYLLQDSVIDYIRHQQLYGYKCDNKYCAMPSPIYDIMDYVDCELPNSPMVIQTKEDTEKKSSLKLCEGDKKEEEVAKSPKRQDYKEVSSPMIMMAQSGSPRRMMETEIDSDSSNSNSPKTVQNMACMADLGTIVRRVRNYNLQEIFHPKKIQPK